MIRSLLVASSFLALFGCGPVVTVGEPCTTRGDCGPSYSCFLKTTNGSVDVPGGYCSRGCTAEGAVSECAAGTLCTFFGDTQLICATECTTDAQCREGYACADVAGTSGAKKSCRPKTVTR